MSRMFDSLICLAVRSFVMRRAETWRKKTIQKTRQVQGKRFIPV